MMTRSGPEEAPLPLEDSHTGTSDYHDGGDIAWPHLSSHRHQQLPPHALTPYSRLKARPITIRLTSLVPAPISYSLASLSSLPALTSFM